MPPGGEAAGGAVVALRTSTMATQRRTAAKTTPRPVGGALHRVPSAGVVPALPITVAPLLGQIPLLAV